MWDFHDSIKSWEQRIIQKTEAQHRIALKNGNGHEWTWYFATFGCRQATEKRFGKRKYKNTNTLQLMKPGRGLRANGDVPTVELCCKSRRCTWGTEVLVATAPCPPSPCNTQRIIYITPSLMRQNAEWSTGNLMRNSQLRFFICGLNLPLWLA